MSSSKTPTRASQLSDSIPAEPLRDAPAPAPGVSLFRKTPASAVHKPKSGLPPLALVGSVRGLAMLSIFATHATMYLAFLGHDWSARIYVYELGRAGVALFFVLSGFLLYLPFAQARLSGSPLPGLKRYYIRRGLRIIPAYWFALIVIAIWLDRPYVFTPEGLVTYFGFLQVYGSDTLGSGIAQAWQISVLVAFYLLLPLWAVGMRAISVSSVRSYVWSEAGMLVALLLASVAWKVETLVPILATVPGGTRPSEPALYVLPTYLDYFAVGMGLAVAYLAIAARDNPPLVVRVIQSAPGVAWLVGGAAFCAFVALDPWRLMGEVGSGPAGLHMAAHILKGIAVVAFLLPAIFATTRRGVVTRILANRVVLWFGVVSYGFFLWHGAILGEVRDLVPLEPVWFVTISLAISLVAGAVSYYVVEKPALSLGRSLPLQSGIAAAARRRRFRGIPVVFPVVVGVMLALVIALPIYEIHLKSVREREHARLATKNGRAVLVSSRGTFQVVPDAVDGFVERQWTCGETRVVEGWAGSTASRRSAERVWSFADGRLLAAGAPDMSRPDVARSHGTTLERSGFRLTGSGDRATGLEPRQVRVFAALGGRASELPIRGRKSRSAATRDMAPLSTTHERARLVRRRGRLSIVTSSGTALVVPNAVGGFVDRLLPWGDNLIATGWAADFGARRVADCVLVFAAGRLLAALPPVATRLDIGNAHGRALEQSGFHFDGPRKLGEQLADPWRVRVFAVVGRRASELKRTQQARSELAGL